MDKILSIQTIKNVFAALGAKTSDSNYGVALLDKTSGEPKGLMGMSDLASVLGVSMIDNKGRFVKGNVDTAININSGIFLAGVADTEYNEGSLFFIRKKVGEDSNKQRLDSGTSYSCNTNSGGTFVANTNTIPSGRHWYCWSLQLA